MRIGELAERTGTTTKTIRYYEAIGLLPEPERDRNDYRDYGEDAFDRLRFIRDAQATGLTLTEIASIVDLRRRGESTCRHVIDLLERHMAALDEHIENLRRTRRNLGELTERARDLDPADCRDTLRCQTIDSSSGGDASPAVTRTHLHTAPARHDH